MGGGFADKWGHVPNHAGLFLGEKMLHKGYQFVTNRRPHNKRAGKFLGSLQIHPGDMGIIADFSGLDAPKPRHGGFDKGFIYLNDVTCLVWL